MIGWMDSAPTVHHATWLCPDAASRERLLDMDARLKRPRAAAFGVLAIAGARDTTIRTSGDTLRADLSSPGQVWRVTTVGTRLTAAERIVSGRVVERLTRDAAQVRYANIVARRSLAIDIQRTEAATAFPRAIWTR